jgi:hypothetical protein
MGGRQLLPPEDLRRGLDLRSQVSPAALGTWVPEACCTDLLPPDEAKRLFVVGHVGNHLSDTTSA